MKKQTTNCEKTFTVHVSDKGLCIQKHKELLQPNNRLTISKKKKKDKRLHTHFKGKGKQMANGTQMCGLTSHSESKRAAQEGSSAGRDTEQLHSGVTREGAAHGTGARAAHSSDSHTGFPITPPQPRAFTQGKRGRVHSDLCVDVNATPTEPALKDTCRLR